MAGAMMIIPAGTVCVQEGEVCLDMYKIVNGFAEVYTGYQTENEVILEIISTGMYFGELGLLTGQPSIYTVVAYSDVTVYRVPASEILLYVTENPRDTIAIMKHMANQVMTMRNHVALLMSEIHGGGEGSGSPGSMVIPSVPWEQPKKPSETAEPKNALNDPFRKKTMDDFDLFD